MANIKILRRLAQDALEIADPTACLQMEFDDEVTAIEEALLSIQSEEPAFAMTLNALTLATYLGKAVVQDRSIEEVLMQSVREQLQAAA